MKTIPIPTLIAYTIGFILISIALFANITSVATYVLNIWGIVVWLGAFTWYLIDKILH